jgi:hypothetical protein
VYSTSLTSGQPAVPRLDSLLAACPVFGDHLTAAPAIIAQAKGDDSDIVAMITVTFDIAGDDKEHQDAVKVRIISPDNHVSYDKEIVSTQCNNGNDTDPNAYYWPKDGPGKHAHSFNCGLKPFIATDSFDGSTLEILSYLSNHNCSDFESWIANVSATAITTGGTRVVKLNKQDGGTINFQNDGSPGSYRFTMTLGPAIQT